MILGIVLAVLAQLQPLRLQLQLLNRIIGRLPENVILLFLVEAF